LYNRGEVEHNPVNPNFRVKSYQENDEILTERKVLVEERAERSCPENIEHFEV
jgi:hypothetical protein